MPKGIAFPMRIYCPDSNDGGASPAFTPHSLFDTQLATEYSVALIAPNRRHGSKTQDGRPLRGYQRR